MRAAGQGRDQQQVQDPMSVVEESGAGQDQDDRAAVATIIAYGRKDLPTGRMIGWPCQLAHELAEATSEPVKGHPSRRIHVATMKKMKPAIERRK